MRWLVLGAVFAAGACSSFGSDADAPDADAGADVAAPPPEAGATEEASVDAGPEPPSIISPYRDGGLTYPETTTWTLATVGDEILHYTTDGTTPTAASKSATGSVALHDLKDGTVISWTVGSHTEVHSFTVRIDGPDGGSAQAAGLIIHDLRFETSSSPVTKVPKGVATINVRASLRLWNDRAGCPNCVDVVTMGIDRPQTCFAGGNPAPYPGVTAVDVLFQLPVPHDPGVYPIRVGVAQVYTCQDAINSAAGLSDVQVALLVVEP